MTAPVEAPAELTTLEKRLRDTLQEVGDFLRLYYRSGIRVASRWKELDDKIQKILKAAS